jgi:putative transposase
MPGRGVKINGMHYWAEAFRDPSLENHDVSIRFDPFDMGTAYAFVNSRWTECHFEHYAVLHGRSQKEIMFASKEVRRRSQLHSRGRFTLTARKLAEFLASAESEEERLVQQLRDSEGNSIRRNDRFASSEAVVGEDLPQGLQDETATQITRTDQPEATILYGDF